MARTAEYTPKYEQPGNAYGPDACTLDVQVMGRRTVAGNMGALSPLDMITYDAFREALGGSTPRQLELTVRAPVIAAENVTDVSMTATLTISADTLATRLGTMEINTLLNKAAEVQPLLRRNLAAAYGQTFADAMQLDVQIHLALIKPSA